MSGARSGGEERMRTGGDRVDPYAWIPATLDVLGWISPLAILVALFGAWELYADLGPVDPLLLPAPHAVAAALYDDRALLWSNFTVTAGEVLLGILVAALAGLACAIAIHLSLTVRRSIYPLLVASQTIPIVAIAPILVVWFGFGIGPKLAIIALVCFFPVTVNTFDGLRSVDPELTKLMRTLDASRIQTLSRAEVPAALPYFLSGAKIAVAVAVIGAVFGEWSGSDAGLGHLILVSNGVLDTARVFAAVAVLSAMAIALFALLGLAERRLAWWGEGGRRRALA
jgi:putative hydroxymethylpyrimidine transport system permease protein